MSKYVYLQKKYSKKKIVIYYTFKAIIRQYGLTINRKYEDKSKNILLE